MWCELLSMEALLVIFCILQSASRRWKGGHIQLDAGTTSKQGEDASCGACWQPVSSSTQRLSGWPNVETKFGSHASLQPLLVLSIWAIFTTARMLRCLVSADEPSVTNESLCPALTIRNAIFSLCQSATTQISSSCGKLSFLLYWLYVLCRKRRRLYFTLTVYAGLWLQVCMPSSWQLRVLADLDSDLNTDL